MAEREPVEGTWEGSIPPGGSEGDLGKSLEGNTVGRGEELACRPGPCLEVTRRKSGRLGTTGS